jgi:hypothetical protein
MNENTYIKHIHKTQKEWRKMRKEEQPVLSDFIEKDQFELNSYLTSLLETTSEKKESQS